MGRPSRAFLWGLTAIALGALGVRLFYIFWFRAGSGLNPAIGVVGGDSFFYSKGAWLLPHHGFISPEVFLGPTHQVVQSAEHPPLYLLWLGIPSVFHVVSPVAQMTWSALLGTTTVVLVGLLGREIAGGATGLVAAGLAAVYPNVWAHDGFLQSETMAIFTVTLTLLIAYNYWHHPTTWRAVALGFACGLATLSRAELVLLFVLVLLPLVVARREMSARQRARVLVIAAVAGVLPIAPWIIYNSTRFKDPVYLSTGFGVTLASADCHQTYYGKYVGYWNMQCVQKIRDADVPATLDQSEQDLIFRRKALDYVDAHLGRLPVVVAARWGRITDIWNPWQQADLEHFPEGRETWVANSALLMWWVLLALGIAGVFVLRARRVPVYPLLALPVTVLTAITLTFATTRYRATMETVVCVLAATAIVSFVDALRAGRATPVVDLTASEPVLGTPTPTA
jgi:4-amino-4-deoxy-L-arabinose transferase-like glycosyltransferase